MEKDTGLFRAWTGWIEANLSGSRRLAMVQHGGLKTLPKAIAEAHEVEGWVEKDGHPAHLPNGTPLSGT